MIFQLFCSNLDFVILCGPSMQSLSSRESHLLLSDSRSESWVTFWRTSAVGCGHVSEHVFPPIALFSQLTIPGKSSGCSKRLPLCAN